MKHQETNNATTISNGNLTPCSRVFEIPELLEQIAYHLDFDNLENRTNLRLVCHLWRSALDRYIWRSVTLKDNARKRVTILQHHGNHIRHLRCHRVDKTLLQSIARHAPNLETIHLAFDKHSLWATPDHLEEIFLRLQDRLVKVSLLFNFFEVDLKWLEKLKVLKCVTKLVLTVSKYAENLIYACAKVLDCCPGLEDFELVCEGVPVDLKLDMGMGREGALNRLWTGVQKGVAAAIGRQQPATMAHSLSSQGPSAATSTSTTSSTTTSVQGTTNPRGKRHFIIYPFCDMYLHNNLRRFKLIDHAYHPFSPKFAWFAQYCPNLEEIDIHAAKVWLKPNDWSSLAAACPRLRSLRAHFGSGKYDMGCQEHVLALFPRLELLSASTANLLHWSDWKATTIDGCLASHSQDHSYGTTTPLALRALHLRSYFGTLENLLEVLSISSTLLALDTLVIGFPKDFREFSETVTHPAQKEFSTRLKFGSIYHHLDMTDMPWNTVLKESLTRLDISSMILVDQTVVRIMFRRFQELENLRALCVSALHLQYWTPSAFSFALPNFMTFTSFSSDSINTTTPVSYASSIIGTHYYHGLAHLPKVKYHLPSIQDLIVEPIIAHKNATRRWMTVDEAVYALAAMPGLEYLCPRGECMEIETLKALRRVFPRQFMAIPEERLDWMA